MPEPEMKPSPSRWIFALVAPALLVAAACGGKGDSDDGQDSDVPRDSGAPAAVSSTSTVPPAIEAVGHHAENAYDMTKMNDWAKARASVDSLDVALAADSATRAAVDSTLQQLRGAIAGRNGRSGMVAANRLTEIGARLSERYAPAVPVDVTLLDYYGRELEIWAASRDLPKLRETGNAISSTWESLRARVEQRGGTAEAMRFGELVQRVRQARTVPDYAALATPILNEVDALEGVFKR